MHYAPRERGHSPQRIMRSPRQCRAGVDPFREHGGNDTHVVGNWCRFGCDTKRNVGARAHRRGNPRTGIHQGGSCTQQSNARLCERRRRLQCIGHCREPCQKTPHRRIAIGGGRRNIVGLRLIGSHGSLIIEVRLLSSEYNLLYRAVA